MLKRLFKASGASWLVAACAGTPGLFDAPAFSGPIEVRQISDDQGTGPRVDILDGDVVWREGSDSDAEIVRWSNDFSFPITDNQRPDTLPAISGSNIAWRRGSSDNGQIFFYDGREPTRVTSEAQRASRPDISGSSVVWSAWDGRDREIFRYTRGGEIEQLTSNSMDDRRPSISGDKVVWQRDFDDDRSEVFLHDGEGERQLSGRADRSARQPDIGPDGRIVWSSQASDSDAEIVLSGEGGETTVIEASGFNSDPAVADEQVVWQNSGGFFGDKIQLYDIRLEETFDVSSRSTLPQVSPSISQQQAVWVSSVANRGTVFLADTSGVLTAVDLAMGDINGDGAVNNLDINPFVLGLSDREQFIDEFGYAPVAAGDANGDGEFDNLDINPFVELLTTSASPRAVPEPASGTVVALGALALMRRRRGPRHRLAIVRAAYAKQRPPIETG